MFQIIFGLIAGLGPSLALYFWLSRSIKKEPAYRQSCKKSMITGIVSTFPIILTSGVLYFSLRATGIQDTHVLLYQALYTFIVLAFSEELNKYLAFRRFLKKSEYPSSWLDLTVFMTIVGIGFGVWESVFYIFGSGPMVMLMRGIVIPHAGYGTIVGWFYGKSQKTGKRGFAVLGFVISWLLHGLYDFSLSQEFAALSDAVIILALVLEALDLALVIWLIVFVVKGKRNEKYTEPLLTAAAEAEETN